MLRITRSITVAFVATLSILFGLPVHADAQPPHRPEQHDHEHRELPEQARPYKRGAQALRQIDDRLPDVAKAHGLRTFQLRSMLTHDETLFVDSSDELLYFDVLAPGEPEPADPAPVTAASASAAATNGPEFQLESNPGAQKTIFLDFDGHTTQNTSWNFEQGIDTIVSPAYDTDNDPSTWSTSELRVIARSFEAVAEDFAPWDVNVTTIDPGPEALRRTSGGDQEWGVRVVITGDTFLSCGCGGVAYIGAFDDPADEPAFVFNKNFGGVSEAITHEVGHTLLLAHDGNTESGYYQGHAGAGSPSWGPIMGAAYYKNVSQWSQQEYTGANNNTSTANYGHGSDDIAIISSMTNGNNFGYKPDDVGDTEATATALAEGTSTIDGIIGTRHDSDLFSFTTNGGQADFFATPATTGANLDIALTIRDSEGTAVAASNPPGTLWASLSTTLAAGDYTIEVNGVGVGDPSAATPSGYTDYGSIGQYSLAATVPAHLLGDVNCDGQTIITDALLITQYAAGLRTGSTECPLADPATEIHLAGADVDADGYVTVIDALMISQCSAGLPNVLCE